MRNRVTMIVAIAMLSMASTVSLADLAPYGQDFEGLLESSLDQPDQVELANDGWRGFVNVFTGGGAFIYNYGFPAPNGGFGGPAISAVVVGEGGPAQGEQQLVVFSDYNNGDHGNGFLIETNVFQEQVVGAADVGNTWLFEWDAKRGNIDGATTARAFIKTLDPNNGFALTNFLTIDMTNITMDWDKYLIAIFVDPTLEGQILQFGFLNTATNFEGSGVFYDNVRFVNLDDQCPADDDDEGSDLVTLCHIPPGNPSNAHTIAVGAPAVVGHMAHGDAMGACPDDSADAIEELSGQTSGGLLDVFASPDRMNEDPTPSTSNRTRRPRSGR